MEEFDREFGRYRLLRLLGRGGMAEVYLAEDRAEGHQSRQVAIKRILPHYASHRRFVQMLQDEARIASAIDHPNVARVLDLGVIEKQHYIAMEFIDGVDLAAVLRTLKSRKETLSVAASLFIAGCIARGLEAAHGLIDEAGEPLGVIHRDVSPHNILISYTGAAKLIDFGVAKATNNLTETRSGVIKGKLQYMSPEQAQAKKLDARADIFSLGLTLYKMLTGRLPFVGKTEYQIYDQILRRRPTPPRRYVEALDEGAEAVVLKALRKTPAKRFQSAADMAEAIEWALGRVQADYGGDDLACLVSESLPRPSLVERPEHDDDLQNEDPEEAEAGPEPDDQMLDALTAILPSSAPSASMSSVPALPEPADDLEMEAEDTVAGFGEDDTHRVAPALLRELLEGEPASRPQAIPVAGARPDTQPPRAAPPIDTHARSVESDVSLETAAFLALRRRRRAYVAALLAAGALAACLVFVYHHRRAPAGEVEVRTLVVPSGKAERLPAGGVSIARIDAGAQPAASSERQADAAPSAPPLSAERRRSAQRPARGRLTVVSQPWSYVYLDGKLIGNTPLIKKRIRAGSHRLRLLSGDGRSISKRFSLRRGRSRSISYDFDSQAWQ